MGRVHPCGLIPPIYIVCIHLLQVCWTCHEHAEAWSRSGSLEAGASDSSNNNAGGGGGGAIDRECFDLKHSTTKEGNSEQRELAPLEKHPGNTGPGADGSNNTKTIDRGGSSGGGGSSSSSEKRGIGVGMLTKIKGRFGRRAG